MVKVAILGASGYTGIELVRLLGQHPYVKIVALVAERNAGKNLADIYPHIRLLSLPVLQTVEEIAWDSIDAVFCCLPHATTHKLADQIPLHVKVIDLSADFRLRDTAVYEKWYGVPHDAKELQKKAVYGLSEHYREIIVSARIIACPGCYPTSVLLPLVPLLKEKAIVPEDIIIDAKSGVSGAGRKATESNLFTEVNENFSAYKICNHRHMPEIEQILSEAAGNDVYVHFSPHLVPMNRGILSTIYVKLSRHITVDNIRNTLKLYYDKEPFVHIMDKGALPATRQVQGTNHCFIAVTEGRGSHTAVIVSVIDNLVKGASGQAVQNFNILFGFEEVTGLVATPQFP